LNKKLDDLLKFIEPPLSRFNSSGRLSINGGGGSNATTPRYQDPSDQVSSHHLTIPSLQPTPELSHQSFPSPDKDRQLKKIFSEIEYLKFRFSKMSNDISVLKARGEKTSHRSDEVSEEDNEEEGDSSANTSLVEEDRYHPTMRQDRVPISVEAPSPQRGRSEQRQDDSPSQQHLQKWALSKQGDSPLVQRNSGDPTKPPKRQSPTSYGVSPSRETHRQSQ
jgi:hypothetical protein